MIYSENLTNRELLNKAMPLISLSRKEWNVLLKFVAELEQKEGVDSVLYKAVQKVQNNQAKIEVMSNYNDYYADILEEPVREDSIIIFN